MAGEADTALTATVAGAWITTGDTDVLLRALSWPDIPVDVIRSIAEITASRDDMPETPYSDYTQIKLIEAIGNAVNGRADASVQLVNQLNKLSHQLEVFVDMGYTSSDSRILQAVEALKAALESGVAPDPDAPIMAADPSPTHNRGGHRQEW